MSSYFALLCTGRPHFGAAAVVITDSLHFGTTSLNFIPTTRVSRRRLRGQVASRVERAGPRTLVARTFFCHTFRTPSTSNALRAAYGIRSRPRRATFHIPKDDRHHCKRFCSHKSPLELRPTTPTSKLLAPSPTRMMHWPLSTRAPRASRGVADMLILDSGILLHRDSARIVPLSMSTI